MKKYILISLVAMLFITACKKTKSTGHLWLNVSLSQALTQDAVPNSFHTIAGGSLINPSDPSYVINIAGDNSNNRTSKVLDFGELIPGTYQVDSIHAYAYSDSLSYILGAGDTTPVFTITAKHDKTLNISF